MSAILDILTTVGEAEHFVSLAGTGTANYVQRVYNGTKQNGAVLCFTQDAPSAIVAEWSEKIGADNVYVCDTPIKNRKSKRNGEPKSLKELRSWIEARSANNPSHLDDTYGTIVIPEDRGIADGNGGTCGFFVFTPEALAELSKPKSDK